MTTSTSQAQRLGDFVQPAIQEKDQEREQAHDGDDILRIIAIGSRAVVNQHIIQMYQLGYAKPHEWSRPLPTANPNHVMRIMTRRVVVQG